ncbi:unnamed protein product [Brassica rapa subsp. narinosa]|uniref:(rape) hypothetical protein n=1 Tax=Brassica napus TaxID=3708 RepID=A0A817ASG4_BRANA|nr:unnamed protein product [Brassica napus]
MKRERRTERDAESSSSLLGLQERDRERSREKKYREVVCSWGLG